jgi:putative transcriptional regulator
VGNNGTVTELKGQLLIAGGGLFDPNFRQTVILVVEHGPTGALGVVLNRPAPVDVAEAAPALTGLVEASAPLYLGGPVEPRAAVVLAELKQPGEAGIAVFDSVCLLTDNVGERVPDGVVRARVYAGYAGWGPGQIENELEGSSWIVQPATAEDVFTPAPQRQWAELLRRKGGDYAVLAMMPFDPSTN